MTDPDTTASWASAQSLPDLADATVFFLEGHLQQTPTHLGPLDTETAELVPTLVSMNRAGFITTCSQPGQLDPPSSAQRAFVEGFCDETTAASLEVGLLLEDLVVVTFEPGSNAGSSISVTMDDFEPFTFMGRHSAEELDHFRNGHPDLDAALDAAWTVQIFDPVWGRNDRLWPLVSGALDI